MVEYLAVVCKSILEFMIPMTGILFLEIFYAYSVKFKMKKDLFWLCMSFFGFVLLFFLLSLEIWDFWEKFFFQIGLLILITPYFYNNFFNGYFKKNISLVLFVLGNVVIFYDIFFMALSYFLNEQYEVFLVLRSIGIIVGFFIWYYFFIFILLSVKREES